MALFREGLPDTSIADTATEEDRRFNGRNKVLTQVQIRQMDPPHRECMGTMQDLSRDGLYFVVRSTRYALGTRLRLTLPRSGSEWTAEVVRTEILPNGGQGVGVKFLGTGN